MGKYVEITEEERDKLFEYYDKDVKPDYRILSRRSKYKNSFDNIAYVAIREYGAKVLDLAKLFKVNKDTIYFWCRKYPSFNKAIKDARYENKLDKVEDRLHKKALGIEKTKKIYVTNEDTGELELYKVEESTGVPDLAAIMAILTNRRGDNWKHRTFMEKKVENVEKRQLDVSGLSNLKTEELELLIKLSNEIKETKKQIGE